MSDATLGLAVATWGWIYNRLRDVPPGRIFGIPRGGAIVAGLTGRAVDDPEDADVIVDDIVDSGATRERWRALFPGKPLWALIDKQTMPEFTGRWVRLPWEGTDLTADLSDTVVRQLEMVGEDPQREGLLDTPRRVLKALKEQTVGYTGDPASVLGTQFDAEGYDQIVLLRGIRFSSLCEHHLLPFTGTATVGYLPGPRVVGLSKLARLVELYARRLQLQERLTQQVAVALMEHVAAQGAGVVLRAHHACMGCRGVGQPDAVMVTSTMLGTFRD